MRSLIIALALLPAPALARTLDVVAGPGAQERLQAALIDAKPGDIVQLGAGRFALTDGLSLDVDRVTVRGAGPDRSVLDFKAQKAAGEGLLVTSDDVVLRDFAVEDTRGDGIKSKGADRIVYHNVRVEWTAGPKSTNGAYGVYPVASRDILIDRVTVKGAADAGIYVGQSANIVVRNSTASYNVAGIEIENSFNADVYHNTASHNTGGILVFDLPNLPQQGGHSTRVFENRVADNDTPNFGAEGSTVRQVPMGMGVMIMANRNVAVFGNDLSGNATGNVAVVAYKQPFTDKSYNPFPRDIVVRDNRHGRAGWAPGFVGGKELAAAMGGSLAPIFWDGVGGDAASIRVVETVPVVTLNLAEPTSPIETARPSAIDLSQRTAAPDPAPIVLPPSMEAAIR